MRCSFRVDALISTVEPVRTLREEAGWTGCVRMARSRGSRPWWCGRARRYNKRTIKASDVTELERGFGATLAGTDPYGYVTLLRHVQWIHHLGSSVLLEPYVTDSTAWKAELELASYFLIPGGRASSDGTSNAAWPS
jgi:hypothetical protein